MSPREYSVIGQLIARLSINTACLFAIASTLAFNQAQAGLSSENVVVVVNGSSNDSLTIANHYVDLRHIPSQNVVVLNDVPDGLKVSLDEFREKILRPILTQLDQRGLARQTRVIAYSAGFPTSVDISSHTKKLSDPNQQKFQTPTASISSLTFFYRWVLADSPSYLSWGSNFYSRGVFKRHFVNPFGGDLGSRFEAAMDAIDQEDYARAAKELKELGEQHPTVHPLNILAAEAYASAGEPNQAVEQVRLAIRNGWSDRRYLQNEPPLRELFSRPLDLASKRPASYSRLLASLQDKPNTVQGPVGFASDVGWTVSGHRVKAGQGAMTYLLSCVLAVTHPRGSTVDQAVAVLKRAVSADRTYPDAKFGFSKTKDVRSKTRLPGVANSVAWLLSRQQRVEIFSSVLPSDDDAYVGMMLGAATLDLDNPSWSLAPGAIAENLTSLGGAYQTGSQTKLTELLHAGAAMSSGAVAEPYSLQPKFPNPMMYAYYQDGVSAIEAYYLSVTSPYQLLIVGDPLCQPFARPPTDFVRIEEASSSSAAAEPGQPDAVAQSESESQRKIRFTWERLPRSAKRTVTRSVELFLQGKWVGTLPPRRNIEAKIPGTLLGVVECRAALVGKDPTEPRITFVKTLALGEPRRMPALQRLRKDDKSRLKLYADCEGADRIELIHLGRVVATVDGEGGSVILTEDKVGRGPVVIRGQAWVGEQAVPGKELRVVW